MGRSLVNDRAICPNGAFPGKEIQERVPDTETIRTFRLSLSWEMVLSKPFPIGLSSSSPKDNAKLRTGESADRFSRSPSLRLLGR